MTICNICKQKPATKAVTKISGGSKSVTYLCDDCSLKEGGFGFFDNQKKKQGRGTPDKPGGEFGGIFGDDLFGDIFREFFGGEPGSGVGEPRVQERIDASDYMSEAAKEVLSRAADLTQQYRNYEIDSEHLLLALLESKVIKETLSKLKINEKEIIGFLEKNTQKGREEIHSLEFSPRMKRILDLSLNEAQNLRHSYIGPEHLLLALMKEGEGLGAQALKKFKIDYDALYRKVVSVVRQGKEAFVPKMVTPVLDQFSRDLTQLAITGGLDPVIGRTKEIETAIEILARRTKNNPVLIGEPGVGKTAIIEGLAQRIVTGKIPEALQGKRVMEIDLAALLAGTQFRGQFEERVKKILEEIKANSDKLVIFIDEIHLLVGAGTAQESSMDAANMFKPVLARGELHLVGATTLKEYQKYIEKDQALERRFQPVYISEPSVGETIEILRGLRDKYESHHRVKILNEALVAASELSHRYISGRFLPDKAIDLIDQSAARVRIQFTEEPKEIKDLEFRLKNLEKEIEASRHSKEQKKVNALEKEIGEVKNKLSGAVEIWETKKAKIMPEVNAKSIAEIISKLTGIPVSELTQAEKEKLLKLEERIKERLIGQEEAVKAVADAIRRGRAGLSDVKRPIASFLFLGPTGVGKTELARTLAYTLFGSEDVMIRLDMSEYMEKQNVSRLVGAPPGYVGYDEGGQLTEAVRRRPHSIILLDEIEKAHPDVFNILLQVLEDGRLTDGRGRVVNFANTIIIATSNVGSEMIHKEMDKPENDRMNYEQLKDSLIYNLRSFFKPEFLNRIDEAVVFRALEKPELQIIVNLQINRLRDKLRSVGFELEVKKTAVVKIVEEGYDPHFGARELKRVIQKNIENLISQEILEKEPERGSIIVVDFNKESGFKLSIRKRKIGKA